MAEKKEFSEEFYLNKIQELDQNIVTTKMLSGLCNELYEKRSITEDEFEHFCSKVELAKIRCRNSGMDKDERVQFVLNGLDKFINTVREQM